MNRSTNIKSRIFRNLSLLGFKNSDVVDEEIYDEIRNGINHIISESFPDKLISITLIDNVDSYELTADTLPEHKFNVAGIRSAIFDGKHKLEPLTVKRFSELKSAKGTPNFVAVIDNRIYLNPTPTTSAGKIVKLYVYLSSYTVKIDKDTEPEIAPYFDKAIELFSTAQFLIGKHRSQWLNEFKVELRRVRALPTRNHFNLKRSKIKGW
jgi:hypothetical protein